MLVIAEDRDPQLKQSPFYELGREIGGMLGARLGGVLIGGMAYQFERCGMADALAGARKGLGMDNWTEDEVKAFEAGRQEGEAMVMEADAMSGEGYDEAACRARMERIVRELETMEEPALGK
jgi:hypothetical protein